MKQAEIHPALNDDASRPLLRFAPSPNGRLHLGHAYSALVNQQIADELGARLLLRIDDTDLVRCTPVLERQMLEDLEWLGFEWDGEPVRQSERLDRYQKRIEEFQEAGLAYPAFMSRKEVREYIEAETAKGKSWPSDPDGAPHYPDLDRNMEPHLREAYLAEGRQHALRLNINVAFDNCAQPLFWEEAGAGPDGQTGSIKAEPLTWGDIVLSGRDIAASYHLASVIDDAEMGITHVVRGRDLFWSTSVHRLLQEMFGYKAPVYMHHDLVLDADGRKLSKSRQDTSLAELRASGATPLDIRKMIGLGAD